MVHGLPVAQGNELIELREPGAGVAGRLTHAEDVAVAVDLKLLHVFQKVHRGAAAVAREHEADALCAARVLHGRVPAQGDDVRPAQSPGDVLRHIETVAGAGPVEDDVFAHENRSFFF